MSAAIFPDMLKSVYHSGADTVIFQGGGADIQLKVYFKNKTYLLL